MARLEIKLGQRFTVKGILYTCVGHDNGMIWGCENDNDESKPFDYYDILPINEFTLNV